MSALLANYVSAKWQTGTGEGVVLKNPINGEALVRFDAKGLDLAQAFEFARAEGGARLRSLSYLTRAKLLASISQVLQANKDKYYEISMKNSGTVKNDSAVDIEGGLFTLGYYAKLGERLGDKSYLLDQDAVKLSKDGLFQSQHILTPTKGVALLINAFNFPSWGLWEKAAPALLSGVPVIVKPATATAWLTHEMVKDVIDAQILPLGSLSIVCGSSEGLLDQLKPFDVVSFTGSAQTAQLIRSHRTVIEHSVRVNVEADSVNSALLMPSVQATDPVFDLFVKEVVREMTVKSGQKCTAIRRAFVPESLYALAAKALSERLGKITVGNPAHEQVRMGALVSAAQKSAVLEGLSYLKAQTEVIFDGATQAFLDADAQISCCVAPCLLGTKNAEGSDRAKRVHDTEVFGPVATLVAYKDLDHALELIARGEGSLVASLFADDAGALADAAKAIAYLHGRVHIITADVAQTQTGHGNVMPQSLHGGPGRAGGGEELGGVRGLNFYHQRTAIQASAAVLEQI
jgi:3,4-dehydroadipyl-CoA semialdehyde dehydrogenase